MTLQFTKTKKILMILQHTRALFQGDDVVKALLKILVNQSKEGK